MPRKLVTAGRFLKPFGVKGEIRFKPYIFRHLNPEDLKAGVASFSRNPEEGEDIKIMSAWPMPKFWVLHPEGFSSAEDVSRLTNMEFFIDRSEMPDLPDGEYLDDDLIGLKVFEEDGRELGEISAVIKTGANDIWEVLVSDGREVLIPVVDEVVLSVDLDKEKVTVRLMKGLLD